MRQSCDACRHFSDPSPGRGARRRSAHSADSERLCAPSPLLSISHCSSLSCVTTHHRTPVIAFLTHPQRLRLVFCLSLLLQRFVLTCTDKRPPCSAPPLNPFNGFDRQWADVRGLPISSLCPPCANYSVEGMVVYTVRRVEQATHRQLTRRQMRDAAALRTHTWTAIIERLIARHSLATQLSEPSSHNTCAATSVDMQ